MTARWSHPKNQGEYIMRKLITVLLTMGLATTAMAQGKNKDIIVVSYPDFIAVDLNSETHDLQFQVAGPDNYQSRQTFGAQTPGYFETQSAEGEVLADGLYKWEAWTTPVNMISREDSAAMADRNSLAMTTGGSSPGRISGSFRVIGGAIVDPDLAEGSATVQPIQGANQ
jgi:hypothetical protein